MTVYAMHITFGAFGTWKHMYSINHKTANVGLRNI